MRCRSTSPTWTSTLRSSNGTIDAAEFICPHDDESSGCAKVAKYNYIPCWWESGGMVHLVVNLEKWNALPKSYQAIVARACDAANIWMLAKYDAVNPSALKRLIAAGAMLKPFSQPIMDACYKAANEHYAEIGSEGRALQEGVRFRQRLPQGAVAWWQIAEHACDSIHDLHARRRVTRRRRTSRLFRR